MRQFPPHIGIWGSIKWQPRSGKHWDRAKIDDSPHFPNYSDMSSKSSPILSNGNLCKRRSADQQTDHVRIVELYFVKFKNLWTKSIAKYYKVKAKYSAIHEHDRFADRRRRRPDWPTFVHHCYPLVYSLRFANRSFTCIAHLPWENSLGDFR